MPKSRVIFAAAPQIENVRLSPSFSLAGYAVSRPAIRVKCKGMSNLDPGSLICCEARCTLNKLLHYYVQYVRDDDDDDDDILTLLIARFPEFLSVVSVLTKQAVTICISMAENKPVRNRAHGSIIPVRKENCTIELCVIPSRTTCNQISPGLSISMVLYCIYTRKKKKKKEKREEGTETRKNRQKKRKKNEANIRSGRRPSPEDNVAVCWYDQSYDVAS